MNADFIIDGITRILSRPGGQAVCLNGAWGVGKTHFWFQHASKIVESLMLDGRARRCVYLSLNGCTSVEQYQFDLAVALISKNGASGKVAPDGAASILSSLGDAVNQAIPEKLRGLTGSLGKFASQVTTNSLKDGVFLIVDDLERIQEPDLQVSICGQITLLKERNDAKIILLSDESKISLNAKNRFWDKLVDASVGVKRPITEAVSLMEEYAPLGCPLEGVVETLERSGITNLRTIKKIMHLISEVYEIAGIDGDDLAIGPEVSRLCTILTLCRFHSNELSLPDASELTRSDIDIRLMFDSHNDDKTDDSEPDSESRKLSNLQKFGYHGFSPISNKILEVLLTGSTCSTELRSDVCEYKKEFENDKIRQKIDTFWCLFHSLGCKEDQFVYEAKTLVEHTGASLPISTADSIFYILDEIGQIHLAKSLFDEFVEKVQSDSPERFKLGVFSGAPKYKPMNDKITEAETHRHQENMAPLRDALPAISYGNSWGDAEKNAVMNADAASVRQLLVEDSERSSGKLVRGLTRRNNANAQEEVMRAHELVVDALEDIKTRSKLDKFRINKWTT